MTDWAVTLLEPGVRVETRPTRERLAPAALEAADAIWRAARRARPALFNGRVFTVDALAPDRIVGHWTEYRLAYAQIRAPALFGALGIRALAVNGIVRCADGVVLGRREAGAVYQAGEWQCPPAGSVEARDGDEVDFARQLAAELREELGLDPARCRIGAPVAAVEHPGTHVIDVGMPVWTPLGGAAIADAHRTGGNREYERIAFVPPQDAAGFAAAAGGRLTEPSRLFLDALG